MERFCKDRDILAVEPVAFFGGGFPAQPRIVGTDGTLSGTSFTSSEANFNDAGIEAGMVLCTYTTMPAEASAWEVVSVVSATELCVSLLRRDESQPPVAPPDGSGPAFFIRSFDVQIAATSSALAEKLRRLSEVAGVASADFADSAQLRTATVFGVLEAIFRARAENACPDDPNWIKADHYHRACREACNRLRLAVDFDGDGRAEQTRTLGHVQLRRV